ncbi:hypothetical protein C7B76_18910 [filamentous cyanobacterium CCP2]|nr:hypothetical protein C7B76_18910 [filamentous cyanobacterium CCP2]
MPCEAALIPLSFYEVLSNMTTSRSLIFSVFLSGFVFSGAALLLMIVGARPLTIQVEDRPLFTGRVQDLAPPYLAVMTGLSFGIGLTSIALLGWRDASRQLEQSTAQVSALQQQLQLQEGMVESLKFSEAKLQAAGLDFFLDAPVNQASPQAASLHSSSQPAFFPHQAEPMAVRQSVPVQAQAVEPLRVNPAQHHTAQHQPSQIEELANSMKQIMSKIEQLQTAQSADRADSVDTSVHI